MKFNFAFPMTESGLRTLKLWQRECDWPMWRKVRIVDIKEGYMYNKRTGAHEMDLYYALCESDFIPFIKFVTSFGRKSWIRRTLRLGWKFDNARI